MVELSHHDRTIKVKIVYYGPALGGKTTNLQVLHDHALAARRGELVSIDSAQDRTILFDLLPLKTAGFRGFDLRLQILAVPGQAIYAATRRLVLKQVDAVVYVANSAADRWGENIQSFREMTENLLAQQLDPATIPLVLQYNKRDLPEVMDVDFMDRALNARQVDAIRAVAVRGEGVLETFSAVLHRTIQDLGVRYQLVDTARGQSLQQWTRQTVLAIFGKAAIVPEPPAAPLPEAEALPRRDAKPGPAVEAQAPPPDRRAVRVALPEAPEAAASTPDERAGEAVVESYVEASAQLSTALAELREERDLASSRLDDVRQAVGAAQDVLEGQPLDPTLRAVLGRMAEAAGCGHASFLVPEGRGSLRLVALRGLAEDPLHRVGSPARQVSARFLGETAPRLHHAADSLDLGEALDAAPVPLAAVLSVPVLTPRGLQGLALFYYTADAALPRPEVVAHLAVVSRALSSSLELARALETVRAAERTLQMALAGTASVRGLAEVVAFLEELRDRLGTMRREPDAPGSFQAAFAELAPSLAGALSTARSLLAFSRGEIRHEAVGIEELLAQLRGPALAVHLLPGAHSVSGDPVLLRLALAALVDHARGASRDETPLEVWAVAEGGRVRISVGDQTARGAGGDGELGLVRRIAELHGGSLTLENRSGLGTRYTLNLAPA